MWPLFSAFNRSSASTTIQTIKAPMLIRSQTPISGVGRLADINLDLLMGNMISGGVQAMIFCVPIAGAKRRKAVACKENGSIIHFSILSPLKNSKEILKVTQTE